MKILKYIMLTSILGTLSIAQSAVAEQHDYLCGHHLGIQGALATGGTVGLGIVDFTEYNEIGLTISGTVNNASSQTNTVTPVLFAGFRHALRDHTYFAWGVDIADTFGTDGGQHLDADYQVGPYISIEQMLTDHVMLAGWVMPYQYEYQKKSGTSVSTNNFFNAGGIAINYLF